MKIYTRKGDSGDTSLFGGDRVPKSSLRIEAYGTVDELNSLLGLAESHGCSPEGEEWVPEVQEQLFTLGADLATPPGARERIERIGQAEVDFLEEAIDQMEEELPALKNFILPGGAPAGATLHLARTVCRRAERAAVRCSEQEEVSGHVITYLNRLSDFLFVLARHENRHAGHPEQPWKPERST